MVQINQEKKPFYKIFKLFKKYLKALNNFIIIHILKVNTGGLG